LFETEAVPFRVWPWLVFGGFVFFLVVEAEKLIIRLMLPSRGMTVPIRTVNVG
jgi:hypothetical protein